MTSSPRSSRASPPPTLLDDLRAALAAFRAAWPRLRGGARGSCALVRGGRVEVVSARRAAALRAAGAGAASILLVELGGGARPKRLTFLAR